MAQLWFTDANDVKFLTPEAQKFYADSFSKKDPPFAAIVPVSATQDTTAGKIVLVNSPDDLKALPAGSELAFSALLRAGSTRGMKIAISTDDPKGLESAQNNLQASQFLVFSTKDAKDIAGPKFPTTYIFGGDVSASKSVIPYVVGGVAAIGAIAWLMGRKK